MSEGVNDTDSMKLNNVVQFTPDNARKENDTFNMEDTISAKSENELMKIQGGMCTLCLEKSETTRAIIGENSRHILDIVLPQIDFTVIQRPAICKNCEEAIIKYFDFKATCLYAHFHIVSFLRNKKDVELDLKDVYLSKNATGTDVPEDQDVCGFCMCLVKNCSAISLDAEEGDMLETMIKQCLPELDLSIIKKPVICVSCRGSLEDCFHFVTNCSTTGEKIKKHCEPPDLNRKGQLELSNSLQLTIKDVTKMDVDGNSADEIKVEEQFLEDIKNPDEKAIGNGVETIKLEQICFDNSEGAIKDIENKNKNFMEMIDQEVSNDQEFKSEDKLAHGEESNKLGSVKIEKIFCEEDESKHKEGNHVEMEDHKYLFNEEIEIKTDEHDFRSDNDIVLTQSEVITRIYGREKHAVNLERDPYINKITLTKKNISKIRMYQNKLRLFQTKHKKPLVNHDLLKHKDPSDVTMYKCESCSFQTKLKYYLNKHSLLHKHLVEATLYKCASCSYETKYRECLKRHLLVHKDPLKVIMNKCNLCPFETKRRYDLKFHLLTHKDPSEVTMYKCDSCLFQTIRKYYLKRHLLMHKDPSEVTMYKCDSCSYETNRKCRLNDHLLVHKDPSKVTMYKCDSCSYETKRKEYLKKHLVVHKDPSKVTVYKCDSCSFGTRRKCDLKIHFLTHKDPSEVKMYKCDSCSFETKRKGCLTSHLLQHKDPSEITMYKCDSCPFQTKYKKFIKKHLLNHKDPSEVTMYKCDSCLYQNKHKRNLKKHLLVHKNPLEVTMYKCDSCSFETKRKQYLKKHVLLHKGPSKVTMYK